MILSAPNLNTYADVIQSLASITVIIDAFEIIHNRQEYSSTGIYNYEILKTSYKWLLKGWVASPFNVLFRYPHYIYLIVIQLFAAILLISHIFAKFSLLFIAVILLIHLLSHLRNQYGLDGSDQMQVILFASLTFFYISPDPLVKQCCLLFICFQALLSYVTAGVAKLSSPVWRGGAAIAGVLNTEGYGSKIFSQVLIKHSALSKFICWSIIIFECAFPLLVFTGVKTCLIFIAAGLLFHLSIALFMGLNSFFWTFTATYPAILFFSNVFQTFVQSFPK